MIKIIKRSKYLYKGKTAYYFYKVNNLKYNNFIQVVLYQQKLNKKSLDEIIEYTISMHLRKKEFQQIRNIFEYIHNAPKINLSYVAKKLNLNYQDILKIKRFEFTNEEAIYILWYLSDKINTNQELSISKKLLRKIKDIWNSQQKNISEIQCICFIKMGKKEYYEKFLLYQKNYITKMIYQYLSLFGLNLSDFNDIYQELIIKQMSVLEKCYSKNIKEITKYLNLSLKGYLIQLLTKIKKEQNYIYLNDRISENKTYLDVISNEYL